MRTHAGLRVYLTDIVEASLESWSSYYETHLHKLHDEQHLHSLQEPAMDNAVATLRIRAELVQSEPRNQPQLKQSTTTETLVGACSGTILTPNTLSRPGSSQSAAQAQEARRQANHHRHLQGPFSSHFLVIHLAVFLLCVLKLGLTLMCGSGWREQVNGRPQKPCAVAHASPCCLPTSGFMLHVLCVFC